MEFRASDLKSLLAEGYRARLLGANVERQDLKRFYQYASGEHPLTA